MSETFSVSALDGLERPQLAAVVAEILRGHHGLQVPPGYDSPSDLIVVGFFHLTSDTRRIIQELIIEWLDELAGTCVERWLGAPGWHLMNATSRILGDQHRERAIDALLHIARDPATFITSPLNCHLAALQTLLELNYIPPSANFWLLLDQRRRRSGAQVDEVPYAVTILEGLSGMSTDAAMQWLVQQESADTTQQALAWTLPTLVTRRDFGVSVERARSWLKPGWLDLIDRYYIGVSDVRAFVRDVRRAVDAPLTDADTTSHIIDFTDVMHTVAT
jgi:hypothetical protein